MKVLVQFFKAIAAIDHLANLANVDAGSGLGLAILIFPTVTAVAKICEFRAREQTEHRKGKVGEGALLSHRDFDLFVADKKLIVSCADIRNFILTSEPSQAQLVVRVVVIDERPHSTVRRLQSFFGAQSERRMWE